MLPIRKVKIIGFSIVAVLLVVFCGAKGYLWYQVKQHADAALSQLSPYVNARYDGIYTSFDGTMGVENIVITPLDSVDQRDAIQVGSILLHMPNLVEFLEQANELKQGHIPNQFGVTVQQITIDMENNFVKTLALMQADSKTLNPSNSQALNCGKDNPLGIEEIKEMGYDKLVGNYHLDYHQDRSKNSVVINFNFAIDKMASFATKMRLQVAAPIKSLLHVASLKPKIAEVSLAYKDDSYNQRAVTLCASKANQKISDYVGEQVATITAALLVNQGVTIGAKLQDAYKQFLINGKEISILIHPANAVDLNSATYYNPNDILKWLRFELRIDNQPIDINEIQWVNQKTTKKTAKRVVPKAQVEVKRRSKRVQKFRITPVSELPSVLGKKIQIKTTNGKTQIGKLDNANATSIIIKKKQKGQRGSVSYTISLKDVTEIQIFAWGPP